MAQESSAQNLSIRGQVSKAVDADLQQTIAGRPGDCGSVSWQGERQSSLQTILYLVSKSMC